MADLDDDALDAWRAFLTAHARITRAIGRDLAAAGLPDLSWYDLLWALYRQPDRRLRVNELARLIAPGDRAGADRGSLAAGVERPLSGLEHGRARAAEHDRGALVEEALGGGAADAAASAGDEDDLA